MGRRRGTNRDLHREPPNENICSMKDRRSHQPRDEAIRAAMRDAGVLAGILEDEFQATYRGPERSEYVRVLTEMVTGLGGSLEAGPIAGGRADRLGGNLRGPKDQDPVREPLAGLPSRCACASGDVQASGSSSDSGWVLETPWGHIRCFSKNGRAGGIQSIDSTRQSLTAIRSMTMRQSSSRRAWPATRNL